MQHFSRALLAATTLPETWLSSRNLAIAIWIGLAILTISLFILGRTRWGQAKPISKCVVLSIFAHLLFAAYAYSTKLIFDYPAPLGEDVVSLAIVNSGDEQAEPIEHDSPPWEEFVSAPSVVPEIAAPVPPSAAPVESQREVQELDEPLPLWPSDTSVESPAQSAPLPEQPGLKALRVQKASAAAAPIDTSVPKRKADKVDSVAVGPTLLEPQRMDASRPRPVTSETRPAQNLSREHVDVASRTQQLTDQIASEATADTTPGTEDRLSQSSNRSEGQRENAGSSFGQDQLIATAVSSQLPGTAADEEATTKTIPLVPPARPSNADDLLPIRLGDGKPMPRLYASRMNGDRLGLVTKYGGTAQTEAAVEAALAWLARAQSENGRWDADEFGAGREWQVLGHDRRGAGADADTGVTGLALLAFLASGHTHLEGRYRKNVQLGLEYLLRSQAENGSLAGDARLFAMMYCHGIAALAINEAYAMTGDQRLKPFVELAVQYTIDAQHPTTGGWRYQPGDRGDMSQFGWQVLALKSAELGGIEIPERTRRGMLKFLEDASSGDHRGLASYRPGEYPSRTMTAEALCCRIFLGQDFSPATKDEAVDYVLQQLPGSGRDDLYYWYYATLAMFQVQGDAWRTWNRAVQRRLLKIQMTSGTDAGSWAPDTVWGGYGGRVYTTAMSTLCLEVYYRHLPTLR